MVHMPPWVQAGHGFKLVWLRRLSRISQVYEMCFPKKARRSAFNLNARPRAGSGIIDYYLRDASA